MRLDPRKWPGRVVPETDREIDAAVSSFCSRASWADAALARIRVVLVPWFAAGWCVDALLQAVDTRPDGSRQGRPRGRDQVAHEFLHARLRAWSGDGSGFARPPLPGMTLGQWWRVNRRNASLNAPRSGTASASVRSAAASAARAHLRDPVERCREKGRRRQEVLDSLLVPGLRTPTFEDAWRLLAEFPLPTQRVCSHCGHVAREVVRSAA
ncbi:hypothetical protein Lesp02_38640 [Lentzea sp. NBRC 105346]|uniref:hypothetical protein n=1 Tax=Lentzea sp. NBRC 105346 TaxID=3032205 RepID=UPI0024A04C02|nr:hypothetical protein [Lentzea sp. NBRC 105346]GLZ31676.1 hypothetical protein Lesp02_38640 [Lentzea sp. NBRC 105346]